MLTKSCSVCKIEKELSEFYSNGYQPSGVKKYKAKCKQCTTVHERITLLSRIKSILAEKGLEYKCELCGYDNNYSALQFHHLDPSNKDFAISDAKTRSLESLREEISKCVVLCANCHLEEHNPHLDKTIVVDVSQNSGQDQG